MQGNPSRHLLVEHQFRVLMVAEAQDRYERISPLDTLPIWVVELPHRVKIHLHFFARRRVCTRV